MKVILLKDVAKIGRRFDVVVVPDGFALNKLIPKGMAEAATNENIKRLENLSSKLEQDREVETEAFKEALATFKDIQVPVEVDSNKEGKMFQALKAEAIVAAVEKATSFVLQNEHIIMKIPIKSVGEHTVELSSGNTHGPLVLNVIAKTK